MRVLVIYCHPVATRYHTALNSQVLTSLATAGHEIDDCDLYAEDLNPVLSRSERLGYHDTATSQLPVAHYVARLAWAEALVFCFPVWCFGLPAMLKGFFDRVFMPGVAFDISDPKNVKPALTHIGHIAAVTAFGRPRWTAWLMGDPPRKVITRYLRMLTGGQASIGYHAHCHMNVATRPQLDRFKLRIGQTMARLG